MEMLEGRTKVHDYDLERLIMLSDGVFAIALTLLALELRPPEHWDGTTIGLVNGMALPFIAFLIAFMSIAFYWTGHRRNFKRFLRSDAILTLFNFIILGGVTLVPVATRTIMEHNAKRDLLMPYVGLIAAIGVATALQWGYAAFIGRLVDPAIPLKMRLGVFLILLLVPGTFSAMGVMAGTGAGPWLYAVMGVLWLGLLFFRRHVGKGYDK